MNDAEAKYKRIMAETCAEEERDRAIRQERSRELAEEALKLLLSPAPATAEDARRMFEAATEDFCTCAKSLARIERAHNALPPGQHSEDCGLLWARAILPAECAFNVVALIKSTYQHSTTEVIPQALLRAVAEHFDLAAIGFRMACEPANEHKQ
jgi:hypothetical protein